MAIPSRQIGWSTTANLLWQISKQLERLTCVTAGGCGTTTTTSTVAPSTTTTTTTICVDFIDSIVISNGSYTDANGTYTRDNPSGSFSNVSGSIFFGGDAWYIFNTAIGNVARNTSTLGTGTWEPWAPGNSSGIIAEYFYYTCPTTTTTTTAAPLVFTNTTFVNCAAPCGLPCLFPLSYFEVWMSQDCIDNWPQIGCQVFEDSGGKIPFSTGNYNDGNSGCIYIENGVVIPTP